MAVTLVAGGATYFIGGAKAACVAIAIGLAIGGWLHLTKNGTGPFAWRAKHYLFLGTVAVVFSVGGWYLFGRQITSKSVEAPSPQEPPYATPLPRIPPPQRAASNNQKQEDDNKATSKTKAPKKSLPQISEPPPPIQNCPNGICVGGDINGTATVNNFAPEPKITFVNDNEGSTTQDATHPRQCIKISIDKAMDSPQFAVICDRACNAVGGGAILPHGGIGGGDQLGSIPNRPDVAAYIIGQPNPMPSNVKYRACVESRDDMPVQVVDVKKLTITGGAK